MVTDFMKYFKNSYDYPQHSLSDDYLEEYFVECGVLQDTLYCHISEQYLNGYINYITPVKAYMIERYGQTEEIKTYPDVVNKFNTEFHQNITNLPDDTLILAKSKTSYWLFWYDKDCSDCAIGRFNKKDKPEQEVIESFVSMASNRQYSIGNIYEIDITHGWRY